MDFAESLLFEDVHKSVSGYEIVLADMDMVSFLCNKSSVCVRGYFFFFLGQTWLQ